MLVWEWINVSQTQKDICDGCSKSLLAVVHAEKSELSYDDDKRSTQMRFVRSLGLYSVPTTAAGRVLQTFRSSHLAGPTCSNLSLNAEEAEPELPTADEPSWLPNWFVQTSKHSSTQDNSGWYKQVFPMIWTSQPFARCSSLLEWIGVEHDFFKECLAWHNPPFVSFLKHKSVFQFTAAKKMADLIFCLNVCGSYSVQILAAAVLILSSILQVLTAGDLISEGGPLIVI